MPNTAVNKPAPYPTEPGTCVIQGYYTEIININETMDEPCKSFPCMAKVVITKIGSCGFGIETVPSVGDTIPVHFIHTLASSAETAALHKTPINLPGLKADVPFEAQLKIKKRPQSQTYEVGNYEIIR